MPGAAGFDQYIVGAGTTDGDVILNGAKLNIDLDPSFVPTLEDGPFDFITYTGTLTGTFGDATGLFGFGDESLYFEIIPVANTNELGEEIAGGKLQLAVTPAPGKGDLRLDPTSALEDDALGKLYSDYFSPITAELNPSYTTTVTQGSAYIDESVFPFVGQFQVKKTGSGEVEILASANYLLGQGVDTAGETGVKITAAGGGIVANADGVAAELVGTASLVGVENMSLAGSLVQRVNTTGDSVDVVVAINGDTAPVLISDSLINELSGQVTLQVEDFAYLSGKMTFKLEPTQNVTLANGAIPPDTRNVNVLTIGADDVVAFAGTNGPYFSDENHNGKVDAGETVNTAAVGLSMEGAGFGLALLSEPIVPGNTILSVDSWYALQRTPRMYRPSVFPT